MCEVKCHRGLSNLGSEMACVCFFYLFGEAQVYALARLLEEVQSEVCAPVHHGSWFCLGTKQMKNKEARNKENNQYVLLHTSFIRPLRGPMSAEILATVADDDDDTQRSPSNSR